MRSRSVTYHQEIVFQALGDATRRALLEILRNLGQQSAGEIARPFSISRPAISKHLSILRRAKLVREHRRGRHRYYQLNPQPLQQVDSWLSNYRVFWQANLQHLKDFLEVSPKAATRSQTTKARRRRS